MNEIVDDVLTISRVETGRLEFNPVQFNLESYCLEVIQEVKASYPDSDISLSFLSQRSEFTLDRKIIRLILINLLSNAVKYSNKPARVKLEVTSSERDLFLTVSDCGIGITEKDQKNLFEYFHRGENTGSIPGTGLGLAIVKKSVEMHGGSISFKSRLNNGTAFFITIPFGH